MLTALLKNAVAERAAGVNVLLYGPPGTGKTELARVAAQSAGLDLYEVEYADRDGNSLSGRDRYRSLQIGQVFLKSSANVALLFDEVEDVFPPISGDAAQLMARLDSGDGLAAGGSVSGKAWVNQILETNPVPVIWVTNRIEQIDPAFRRRFQYHLELKSPPPGAREALVARALAGVEVSADFTARLAGRRGLTPAQVRTAVKFARLAAEGSGQAVDALIERQLAHADKALGSAGAQPRARAVVTNYDLSLTNVESRFALPRIVEALRRRGLGTLCLYGPPGTGKTALAEHIAAELQRPLLVRQASDLSSKFVGETEQNMAKMFADAEAEEAVLLLDEADSFLRSRRRAERSYEVTEVNEMLQGMERFAGIFICTTNLFEELDEAALRRFTFKIGFKPLTVEQRERMFVAEALEGAGEPTAEQRARLARLDALTAGDFAAVKRQIDVLGEAFDGDGRRLHRSGTRRRAVARRLRDRRQVRAQGNLPAGRDGRELQGRRRGADPDPADRGRDRRLHRALHLADAAAGDPALESGQRGRRKSRRCVMVGGAGVARALPGCALCAKMVHRLARTEVSWSRATLMHASPRCCPRGWRTRRCSTACARSSCSR